MRVLIAEDEDHSLQLVELSLRKWGYEPVAVQTGQDALDILTGPNAPPVAILDWSLPELDGVEVCRRLRAHPGGQYVYVIFLTARHQANDIAEALDAGADDYITKPLHTTVLRARLTAAGRVVELQRQLADLREGVGASAGPAAAELAQEVNAALAPAMVLLPMLERRSDDPKTRELVQLVRSGFEAARNRLARALGSDAPGPAEGAEEIDLLVTTRDVVSGLHGLLAERQVTVANDITCPTVVLADPLALRDVLDRLLSAAVAQVPADGVLRLAASADRSRVVLSVTSPGTDLSAAADLADCRHAAETWGAEVRIGDSGATDDPAIHLLLPAAATSRPTPTGDQTDGEPDLS